MSSSRPFLHLAWASLRHRLSTALLTTFAVALAVALLCGVELIRRGVREEFSATAGGTDLIVGARGSGLQLLLYSLFGLGSPTRNLDPEILAELNAEPGVAWTVPIALGDSYAGFRVIATSGDLFSRWRIRQRPLELNDGRFFDSGLEAVIGSEVAHQENLAVGQQIVLRHGLGQALVAHGDHPFVVVGVLNPTGGPLDRAVLIPLESFATVHDPEPLQEHQHPENQHLEHQHQEHHHAEHQLAEKTAEAHAHDEEVALAAVFVGLKSRGAALMLKQKLEDRVAHEPLTAILPGVALTELWQTWRPFEDTLQFFSAVIVLIALLGLTVALRAALEERRRELAILRALGVGPGRLGLLVVLEALLLTLAGIGTGLLLAYGAILALGPWLEARFGLALPLLAPSHQLLAALGLMLLTALLLSAWPAVRVYHQTLRDGLTPRI